MAMNDTSAQRRRAILEEASEWLVLLQDEQLSDADLETWGRWMAASPEHAAAFDDVSALWDAAAGLDSGAVRQARIASLTPASVSVPLPLPTARNVRRRRPRPARWVAGIAASLVAAAGAWFLLAPRASVQEQVYTTGLGETKQVLLADGSEVDLGAASELRVRYSSDERDVELRRGVAFFSVTHAPARSFVVAAGPVRSRVLGTRFTVAHRAEHDVAVTVAEGRVRVSAPGTVNGGSFDVTPGHRVDFSAQGLAAPRAVDAAFATAWRDGAVVYQGEALSGVIADLNRYSRLPVRLQDPALGKVKVTGRWELASTDRWLEGLAQAVGLGIERKPDVILLSRARAENDGGSRAPD